jgi:hypothetical protein
LEMGTERLFERLAAYLKRSAPWRASNRGYITLQAQSR